MSVRRDQLAALARPLARSVRWSVPLVGVAAVALLLVWRWDDLTIPGSALAPVRTVAWVLVMAALPLLDDPSARQVAAVPLPLAWRTGPRLVAAALLVIVPTMTLSAAVGLPPAGMVLEGSAVLAVACAASLTVSRSTDHAEPSLLVSVGVLLLPVALLLLPPRAALLVPPGPLWADGHVRWAVLLAAGVAGLAMSLRDPASHPLHRAVRFAAP